MPRYIYSCPSSECNQIEDVWLWTIPKEKPKKPHCPSHMLEMERDYHLEFTGHIPSSTFPFLHPHIPGSKEPVLITSESHYNQVLREASMRQFGDTDSIRARPDAAFVDDQAILNERGEREIKEGNGAGSPRSWVGLPALLNETPEEIEKFFQRNSK